MKNLRWWALIVPMIFVLSGQEKGRITSPSLAVREKSDVSGNRPYSTETLQSFWEDKLRGTVELVIFRRTYRVQTVNMVSEKLLELAAKRYNAFRLHVSLVESYSLSGASVMAGSYVTKDSVVIELIVPALIDVYGKLRRSGDTSWQEQFELFMVVSLVHELDHLAYGYINRTNAPFEEVIWNEKVAWAFTCEEVLRPLVEYGKFRLAPGDMEYYHAWVRAGYTAGSPLWDEFIRTVYRGTLHDPL
ncbi:MAG: hypothetical protein V1885_03295 [Candidatus Brennerbacteria bacterium]